jgi:hypothetical protein
MARMHAIGPWGAVVALAIAVGVADAQVAASDPAPDSATVAQPPKKKGGLFGKMKSVAGNKAVQSVAKTAACTMVPGGQVLAGAIDAAGSNGADGAAAGAAGAATGTSCMGGFAPGMGAAGVPGGGLPGGVGASAAVDAAMSSMGPGTTMPAGAMGYSPAAPGAAPGMDRIAQCMGVTPEEFTALTDPTAGQARSPTKEEMKRQAKLGKKVDMRKYQACLMQGMPSADE